jgi:UPF0042 nucleotide-binding protein
VDRLVVITGLSGSGKSLAAKCLEDVGFFCVDNLPVQLIPPFVELMQRSGAAIPRAAIVVDVREGRFLDPFPEILQGLRTQGVPVTLLFFESADESLKRRFSETRRPHPMLAPDGTLEAAIRSERAALARLREVADRIIDTSRFNAHELRSFLKASFGAASAPAAGINVHLVSFGFKYGVPAEADLVFDVRFIPNPFFVEGLRSLSGRDGEVRAFVEGQPETAGFMTRLRDMLDHLVPLYAAEGKSYLTVTVGCTGGKHRSVAIVEALREHLEARGGAIVVSHRDLGKE